MLLWKFARRPPTIQIWSFCKICWSLHQDHHFPTQVQSRPVRQQFEALQFQTTNLGPSLYHVQEVSSSCLGRYHRVEPGELRLSKAHILVPTSTLGPLPTWSLRTWHPSSPLRKLCQRFESRKCILQEQQDSECVMEGHAEESAWVPLQMQKGEQFSSISSQPSSDLAAILRVVAWRAHSRSSPGSRGSLWSNKCRQCQ